MIESPNNDKIKKTRNRVPTSCLRCRKRKLKCDRQKPCSNCVKGKTEDLCKYVFASKATTETAVPKVNLNNEVIKLKLQINKLERIIQMNNIDMSEYADILPNAANDDNDDQSYEEDPLVSLCDKFDTMIIKENRVLHSGTTSYATFIVGDKNLSKIFEAYSKRHLMIYESYQQKQKIKASDLPVDVSDSHLSWLTANSNVEATVCDLDSTSNIKFGGLSAISDKVSNMQTKLVLDVLNDVNKVLPPLFVVNVLIDHFFKYVHPLMPYIDEETFREELTYVLIAMPGGGCRVSITHLQNASIVSLLLIVLRYAYLAVNVKDYSEDIKAIGNDFLVAMIKSGAVIESNFMLLARSLLMSLPGEDSMFKRVTFRNIQILLFLRLYQGYAPEMNEESKEHSLTLSIIIQMVRLMGLNRDPDNFPNIYKKNSEKVIMRRVYYKLLSLDVHNSFDYGCPLIISDNEYDVKLPTLPDDQIKILHDFKKGLSVEKSGDEIRKLVFENSINKDIALEYDAIVLLREGLNAFQNFKLSVKTSSLHKVTDKIQNFLDNKIPSIWEYLQDNYANNQLEKLFDVPRVKKIEIRITVQTMLMAFYYLIYINEMNSTSDNETSSSGKETNGSNEDLYFDGNEDGDNDNEHNVSESPNYKNSKSKHYQKYTVRAFETALSLFKFNYDYIKYSTQSVTLDGDNKQYKAFKFFSAKCDIFILNRVAVTFLRPFLFLCSFFLKSMNGEQGLFFSDFIPMFSNSVDASVVLKWFDIDIDNIQDINVNDECRFPFVLFQKIKDLFFLNYCLRNDNFVCWRNTVMIKLFINYFKQENNPKCLEFLNPSHLSDQSKKVSDHYNKHTSSNSDTTPELAKDSPLNTSKTFNPGSNLPFVDENFQRTGDLTLNMACPSLQNNGEISMDENICVRNDMEKNNTFIDDFLNNAVPNNGKTVNFENLGINLDDLIVDDFDNMIENMIEDNTRQLHGSMGLFDGPGILNEFEKNFSDNNNNNNNIVNTNDMMNQTGIVNSSSFSGSSYTSNTNPSDISSTPDIFMTTPRMNLNFTSTDKS